MRQLIIILMNFTFLVCAFTLQDAFKRIALHKNEIQLNVPSTWEVKENYLRYTNHAIVYDVKASDSKGLSMLTLDI